jgi:hypothetical protein
MELRHPARLVFKQRRPRSRKAPCGRISRTAPCPPETSCEGGRSYERQARSRKPKLEGRNAAARQVFSLVKLCKELEWVLNRKCLSLKLTECLLFKKRLKYRIPWLLLCELEQCLFQVSLNN